MLAIKVALKVAVRILLFTEINCVTTIIYLTIKVYSRLARIHKKKVNDSKDLRKKLTSSILSGLVTE